MKKLIIFLLGMALGCTQIGREAQKVVREVEETSKDYLYSVVGTIVFSQSGKLAYVAQKGEGQVVVFDGKEGPLYDRVTYIGFVPYLPAYSTGSAWISSGSSGSEVTVTRTDATGLTGERLIYVGEKDKKKTLVDGGTPGREYEDITDITCLADGRVLYKAKKGEQFTLVADTTEGRFYDEISGITFDYTGLHMAYWATVGDSSFVVFDGAEGPRYSRLPNLRKLKG